MRRDATRRDEDRRDQMTSLPRRKSQNSDVTSYDSIISNTDLLEEFTISYLTRVGSEVSL